jgi:hypothetical protein
MGLSPDFAHCYDGHRNACRGSLPTAVPQSPEKIHRSLARLAAHLDFARDLSGAYSWEHVPVEAAASGWVAITPGQPDLWARPALPAGAEPIPGSFRLPQVEAPLVLPQFFST